MNALESTANGDASATDRSDYIPHHRTGPPIGIIAAFALAIIFAFLLKLAAEHWIPEGTIRTLLDHSSIAIIVASILGLTYDFVLNNHREEATNQIIIQFRKDLDSHQKRILEHLKDNDERTHEYLKAYAIFTPKEIFDLLLDIASQTSTTPTLYHPARNEPSEYTFAKSIHYFDKLVAVQRKEIIEIIRDWIRKSDHPNVKFLASDFVGKYRLKELAGELRDEAYKRLSDNIPEREKDKPWILNYIWAFSRCEDPMYESLKNLLYSTDQEWIQEWILTVPVQMPERGFIEILAFYLQRGDTISLQNRKRLLKAFAALARHGDFNLTELFHQHAALFNKKELLDEVDGCWRALGLSPEPIRKAITDGQPVPAKKDSKDQA